MLEPQEVTRRQPTARQVHNRRGYSVPLDDVMASEIAEHTEPVGLPFAVWMRMAAAEKLDRDRHLLAARSSSL